MEEWFRNKNSKKIIYRFIKISYKYDTREPSIYNTLAYTNATNRNSSNRELNIEIIYYIPLQL